MKWILVVLLATQLALYNARPSDNLFEIEKLRLVKFPQETFRYEENDQKSNQAKRILEEINKINVALGYVKKQESNLPSILDSNQFLFPKPSYHPFHSQANGGLLQPSIRNIDFLSNASKKSHIPKLNELNNPKTFYYFYVPKSLTVSSKSEPRPHNIEVPVQLAAMTKNENIKHNNPREFKLIDYKVVSGIGASKEEHAVQNSSELRLYFAPRDLKINEKSMDYLKNEKLHRIEKLPTIQSFSKPTTQRTNTKSPASKGQKVIAASSTTTAPISSLKTPFASFFKRPSNNVITVQNIEPKPILQSVPLSSPQSVQQQTKPPSIRNDEYKLDTSLDSSEENDYSQEYEKHIFSSKRKEMAEVQKEAFKESGIIIQRLKVRKGGIAIAGPGGVATAGSGGTAIVGPGGYALTHPRSLTIAGPGAKVIAIPETTDLKDALLRTNSGKSYVDEGEVVATGPVVYYSPGDNTQIL